MADSNASLLLNLLKSLDALYPVLFNLTVKAQEKDFDPDSQMALEETRQGILDDARHTLDEARDVLTNRPPEADEDLSEIANKIESLVWLLRQIQALDKQRSAVLHEEQEALRQSLHQVHIGKHVATTYQKSDLLKD